MKACWLSAGVSSFIAAYLERETIDHYIYIHISDQHPDTMRFLGDCQKILAKGIEVITSRYGSVNAVIKQFRFINSARGAKCTEILKKRVRKEWEYDKTDLIYVWGYDITEKHRAEQVEEANPEQQHVFPLIERGLTKEDCHGILRQLGIKRPAICMTWGIATITASVA